MKENFKEKMRKSSEKEIKKILDLNLRYKVEAIAETFTKEFLEYDQGPHSMGAKMCQAYLDNDVDAMLEALCGDCMDTILEKAGILEPFEERMEKMAEENSSDNDANDGTAILGISVPAELIAKFIVETGLENTTTGKWLILYDAIDDAFGVWLPRNKALFAEVLQIMKEDYSEVVAEIDTETWGLGIAVYYYTDRCPNVVVSKMETPTEERKN